MLKCKCKMSLILFFSFLNISLYSQGISVLGEATVLVPPDYVQIYFSIENRDKDINIAKKNNDENNGKVIKVFNEFAINAKDVQTEYLSILPRYRYDDDDNVEIFIGYEIRRDFTVTLRDFTKFENLLNKLLQNGVKNFNNIGFGINDLKKHRDLARKMAVQAAIDKANLFSSGFGAKVGKPITITEEPLEQVSMYNFERRWSQSVKDIETTDNQIYDKSLLLGQISIKASVSVVFELK